MHPRTQEILDCLDIYIGALRSAVDAVPETLREQRPAPDRWSVAEVLEHVAMVEKSIAHFAGRQLAAAREAGLEAESDTSSVIATMPVERVARRDRVLVAPDRLQPTGALTAEAAWQKLEDARGKLRDVALACDGLAVGNVTFPHPYFGPLNLYQWMLFAAGHSARHAAQIHEIAESRR